MPSSVRSDYHSTQILNNEHNEHQQVKELVEHKPIQDTLSIELNNSKIHALWTDFDSENLSTKVISASHCTNGFVATILQAYSSNQHLFLTPDDVWLVIAQGISQHINNNAEKYRQRIVNHQGQKRVEIYGQDLLEDNEENNWITLFDRLNRAMDELITIKDLLTCNFSTSTKSTKISSELVMLNSVHSNSSYNTINNLSFKSGIHKITLDGTLDDWLNIQQKIYFLKKLSLDLDFWLDRLEPVINQFISTYKGDVDLNFWNTVAIVGKEDNITLTGWISAFFPYAKGNIPLDVNCIRVYDIPDGRISIPFVNENDSSNIKIISGFFGTKQELQRENNEIIVSPVIGWVITDL
ncbi:hypothetical protein C1645_748882 [Glomus cerebriforme]|uniref:DUF4419 domain-containing protein n=1 Tax=Glomus cerebriforme TaxID=658196 RepID=A0A397TQE4_9GLOM|nr:hypothetical protein C1645_748882 [Glomus cerebriforme]